MAASKEYKPTNAFLEKLTQIIRDNFSNEQFGVETLAEQCGVTRTHLYKKIKKLTGKSASQFIREVRLDEALEQLKSGKHTVADVAFNVGFSSHAYFATCFKDYFGYSPKDVKSNIANLDTDTLEIKDKSKSFSKQKVLLTSLFFIVAVAVILVILLPNGNNNEKTIAVLPFKNLSTDENNELFCDGLAEDILTYLQRVDGLVVLSFTSVKKYRNSNKTIPEIAKELGVAYLVEGSVRQNNDQVVVTAQLISAEDQHLWANNYQRNLENPFAIQQQVSQEIVKALEIELSPNLKERLTFVPTQNAEAYSLFKKAMHYIETRQKGNMEAGIFMLEKAVQLDPDFAEAYAEIGMAKLLQLIYNFVEESPAKIDEVLNYAKKALKLNPDSFRAYNVIGLYNRRILNFDEALKNYLKGLTINPNDYVLNYHISLLYAAIDNDEENFKYLKKANKLYPNYPQVIVQLMSQYKENGRISQAIEMYENKRILLDTFHRTRWRGLIKACLNEDWLEYIKAIESMLTYKDERMSNNALIFLAENSWAIERDLNKRLNYTKLAMEKFEEARFKLLYFRALIASANFKEIDNFLAAWENTTIETPTAHNRLGLLFAKTEYYLSTKNYKKSLEIVNTINESISMNYFSKAGQKVALLKAVVYAKNKQSDRAYEIMDARFNYPSLYIYKAIVFAAMEKQDSMYFYLKKSTDMACGNFFVLATDHPQFEPYRDQPRFKEFLRKAYLSSSIK